MEETSQTPERIQPSEMELPRAPHPLIIAGVVLSLLALVIMGVLGLAPNLEMSYTTLALWGAAGPLAAALSGLGIALDDRRVSRALGGLGLTLGCCAALFLVLVMVDKAQRERELNDSVARQHAAAHGAPATPPATSQPEPDDIVIAISDSGSITVNGKGMPVQALGPYLQSVAAKEHGRQVVVGFSHKVDTKALSLVLQACNIRGLNFSFGAPPRERTDSPPAPQLPIQ
jgi:biopolymer transport protein ExbD